MQFVGTAELSVRMKGVLFFSVASGRKLGLLSGDRNLFLTHTVSALRLAKKQKLKSLFCK